VAADNADPFLLEILRTYDRGGEVDVRAGNAEDGGDGGRVGKGVGI
jgi:hypothetical protein